MSRRKLALILLVGFVAATAGAASLEEAWDNLKLRYFSLTRFLHDQDKELRDLEAQGIDPAEFTRIDLDQLLDGGPPKDGIPSIDEPRFDRADETPFGDDALVLGLVVDGDARAYPYGILNWHEIVNDTVGGVPVTITYCPLCDTGIVFERGDRTFGVSGKLYQSCLVMYARDTETLFAQPWGLGIVGPEVDQSLDRLPVVKTTLGAWRERHAGTRVLSVDTGHRRDYFESPYGTYDRNRELVFPVRNQDALEVHPKAIVSYVWEPGEERERDSAGGPSAQVVHTELKDRGEQQVRLGERVIRAQWDAKLGTVTFTDEEGRTVPSSTAFAFVYPAFFGE
ncbi:MAG: DUF3179 domain-containing protein [Gammaproteobacteria bacterium]|nr:DUF3179 domain-containing protein [Gammaproteobacteria bacterium]